MRDVIDRSLAALAGLSDPRVSSGAYHVAVGAIETGSETGSVYLLSVSLRGAVSRWTRISSGFNNFTATLSAGAKFGSALAVLLEPSASHTIS